MCWPIIGGIISGAGAAMGALGRKASLKGQAEFEKRQAGIETATAGYKAQRTQDEVSRVAGAQRAGFAANGIAMTGSAADTVASTAEEGALDVAAIRWNSQLAADNMMYKSKLSTMNAKIEGQSAIPAFAAPVINGIATYASSFG